MVLGIDTKKFKLKSIFSYLYQRIRSIDVRITAMTRRIILVNIIGQGILIGVLVFVYLPQFKDLMISQRIEFLQRHGDLIALIVAEAAGRSDASGEAVYNPLAANQVLRRIVNDIGGRARLYDKTGRLTADTRNIFGVIEPIQAVPLSDAKGTGYFDGLFDVFTTYLGSLFHTAYPVYHETNDEGITNAPEVYTALEGTFASAVRQNSSDDLIVSVAIPVQKFKAVIGALVLSTDSGDIDQIVTETRQRILELFGVVLLISIITSMIVAYTIAYPIAKLTRAARQSFLQKQQNTQLLRVNIPDMQDRGDEIGDLSTSLREMTNALYSRIDAIEAFAADVAHEIKNPLTSLRSAVESLRIVRDDKSKEKLMRVIEKDVVRMDRLLTDISNASRLDAELVREKATVFDVNELLHNVIEAKSMAEPNVAFTFEKDGQPYLIEGLENRIAQVFQNIIENGLSFIRMIDQPEICIEMQVVDAHVMVSITDNGPGIPEGAHNLIFNRFYSSRPDHEDFGRHSGLGLSICDQIIKAHSGKIWADNVTPPMQGARFCILIPIKQDRRRN